MNVIQVSAEASPFCRRGNLGDAVSGLCNQLVRGNHRLTLFLPGYRSLLQAIQKYSPVREFELAVTMGHHVERGDLFSAHIGPRFTLFVVVRDEYFDRSGIYGNTYRDYEDNDRRFIFFSRAVVDSLVRLNLNADILHCHEWPVGIIPALARYIEAKRDVTVAAKTVFTVHNIDYQGLFPADAMEITGLPQDVFTPDGIEFYNQVNLLKGGINFADAVTLPGAGYLKEVSSIEDENGLEGTLVHRREAIHALPHGIDTAVWNPQTDTALGVSYGADRLSGKASCRSLMLAEFGVSATFAGPVYLAENLPGINDTSLLEVVEDFLAQNNVIFVLVGLSESAEGIRLGQIERRHPGKLFLFNGEPDNGQHGQIWHRLMAGADFLLSCCPEDPAHTILQIAQAYGTVPLAANESGAADFVKDLRTGKDSGTGLLFERTSESLKHGLAKSIGLYDSPELMETVRRRGMAYDFTWERAAKLFVALYRSLL